MRRRLLPGLLALAVIAALPARGSAQLTWTIGGQVTGSTVFVTWPPPPDGSTPTAYQVEIVLTASGQSFAIVNVGPALTFTATLPNGAYTVRVRAVYANGASLASSDVAFNVGPPAVANAPLAPLDLRAEIFVMGPVTLSWNVNLASPPATSFIIEVGSAPTLSNLGVFDTGSPALSLVAVPPAPGTYYVRVRARNGFGVSPPSIEIPITIFASGGCAGPPQAPTGLIASVVGLFVTLNWTQPVGQTPVTGYLLEVGSAAGLVNVVQSPIGATTVFGAIASPGTYFARVRALSACGQSGVSNEVVVTVP